MTRRTLLLLAVPVLLVGVPFAGLAAGLTAWGGPHADDPAVAAAHRAGLAALDREADAVLDVAGTSLLDRTADDRCLRGSRAVGGLGVDTGHRLRCSGTVVLQTAAGDVGSWPADAAALHARLVEAGWEPHERDLLALVAQDRTTLHGGLDGRAGPADLAAAIYSLSGTELSIVFAEPGERPHGPTDHDDAMGHATADRLPAGGYGVVLRLGATTFED